MMDKLKEYLDRLRKTPDRKVRVDLGEGDIRQLSMLTAELGVYDNYSILLRANISEIIQFLKNKKYDGQIYSDSAVLNHPKGFGGIDLSAGTDNANLGYLYERQDIVSKLVRDYNLTAIVHPAGKELAGCASMIIDVIEFIRKEKIPACFPTSMGWRNQRNFSRVVYYNPTRPQK